MKRVMLTLGLVAAVGGNVLRAQGVSYSSLRHHVHSLAVAEDRDGWNVPPILVERGNEGSRMFSIDDPLAPAIVLTEAARELPPDLHGTELNPLACDPTTITIGVDSEQASMGDDLYAQSFTIQDVSNVLSNARMLSLNPADVPPRGNGKDRIMIPDAVGGKFIIPSPAPVLLGAWGVLLTGWLRLRRWL